MGTEKGLWLVVLLVAVLLGGCGMTSNMKYENNMLIQEVGQTNLFRPSMSVMRISECVPEEDVVTVIDIDGNSKTCYGRFVEVVKVQGTQAGSLTGIGSAAIQGGAIVGGAYLLADGIRDSGDETTNNNNTSSDGGNSSSLSSNRNDSLNQNFNTNATSSHSTKNDYTFNKGRRGR